MRRSALQLGLASVAAIVSFVVGPVPARAEPICGKVMPAHVSYAQGLAFIATIGASERSHDSQWHYLFNVEHVVVRAPFNPPVTEGTALELNQAICEPVRLDVGQRYLITTNPAGGPFSSPVTLVWRLDGDRASFVSRSHGRAYEWVTDATGPHLSLTTLDRDITSVRTLSQAINLVMHGSMPETDTTAEMRQGSSSPISLGLVVAGAFSAIAAVALRRRRLEGRDSD